MRRSPYPVVKHSIFGTCATEKPAASLRCVKCRLVDKTQYIRHLRDGDACGLSEVREVQISQ